MKVNIGNYNSWLGPYQLAELLCFWAKKIPDECGMMDYPDWVHNFGEFLATGGKGSNHKTWLYKLLEFVHQKKKRKTYVRVDPWDTYSMDHTLALVILPMLKQLKEKQHGAPFVADEDVPTEIRSTSAPAKENEYDTDEFHFKRWDYVLDEMIFAFSNDVNEDWEDEFRNGERDIVINWGADGEELVMSHGPNHTEVIDREGMKKHMERVEQGHLLFGKYYSGLWD